MDRDSSDMAEASGHFSEVEPLAKRDTNGNLAGIWGTMSDCSHSFKSREDDFNKGLHLPRKRKELYVFPHREQMKTVEPT